MARPLTHDVRLNIRISKDEHEALKTYTEERGTTISDLVRNYINDLLKEEKNKKSN